MSDNQQSPIQYPRPLVVRMGAMGDMVMLTPLLRRLYERTGMAADLVVCGEWNRKLFAHCPWVNTIYSVASRNTPYWFSRSKQLLVKELRASDTDRSWFFLEHLPRLYRLIYRANLKKEFGITNAHFPRQIGEHTCSQFLRLADASSQVLPPATQSPVNLSTELHSSEADIKACKQWLKEKHHIDIHTESIVMIQAGNKRNMRKGRRDRESNKKYWPEENWAEMILRIADSSPNTKIILCGAPSEVDLCNDILQLCNHSVHRKNIFHVADDLPIPRLMALATLAKACISVDTGPAHVAAALGCPLVVLFGRTDPRQFRPLGVNQVMVVAKKDWRNFAGTAKEWSQQHSMEDISVDMVIDSYKEITLV